MLNFLSVKKETKPDLIKILIIDDDSLILDTLKSYGTPSQRITLLYCGTAEEAVDIVRSSGVHGVFSDVEMRNMNYLDKFLYDKASEIPVYRFSGKYSRHLNIRLTKPFDCKEYFDALLELAGLANMVKKAA